MSLSASNLLPAQVVESRPSPNAAGWLSAAVLVLAVAGVTRIYGLGDQSLWLDEIITLYQTTGKASLPQNALPQDTIIHPAPSYTDLAGALPWWRLWGSLEESTGPPLYVVVLRLWREAFGADDVSARAFSALCSWGAVLLLLMAGGELFGRETALWAAAMAAVASPQVYFAQEVRPYGMMLLLSMALWLVAVRIKNRGMTRARWMGLVLCLLALALTHYFMFGGMLAVVTWLVLFTRGPDRRKVVLAVVAAALIFLLAWGPFMWQQRGMVRQDWLLEIGPEHLPKTLIRLAALPVRFFRGIPEYGAGWAIILGPVLYLLPLLAVRKRPEVLLPWLWTALCIAPILALDLVRQTSHLVWLRYTVLAAPGLFLGLAATFLPPTEQPQRMSGTWLRLVLPRLMPAAAVLLALWFLPKAYEISKLEWRSLGQILRQNIAPGETLIFPDDGTEWYPRELYRCLSHYGHSREWRLVFPTKPLSAQMVPNLSSGGHVWMLSLRPFDPDKVISGAKIGGITEFPYLARVCWLQLPKSP